LQFVQLIHSTLLSTHILLENVSKAYVRQPYARNATATPKGQITESTLFQLLGHIYGSVDSCIPTALQLN